MTNRIFRAAVGAFLFNQDGQLLVILKHNYVDKWDILKGGIDFNGEDDKEALSREIKEELGDIEYQIIKRSMTPKVYLKDRFEWKNIASNEFIGQAQINYWVFLDKNQKFKIPNNEVEKFAWIDITKESIKKYFNIHDAEGTYANLLPLEWEECKEELLNHALRNIISNA